MLRSAVAKSASVLSKLPQQSKLNLVQTRKMFNMDPEGFEQKYTPSSGVGHFMVGLDSLNFYCDEPVKVLDIGCGPGRLSAEYLYPLFREVTKWYAIDILPGMIEYAKKNFPEENLEYHQADIEDWESVKQWEGTIHKVFAVDCFQWVPNQRRGFVNMYKLMVPGGTAAIFMTIQAMYFEAMKKLHEDPKWKSYFTNVGHFIGVAHTEKHRADFYRKMLHNIGFSMHIWEENVVLEPFSNDQACRDYLASICGLVQHVPEHRREEFKDELFLHVVRECGRNSEGRPQLVTTTLDLVMTKD